jgi:(+)-trans-carveol dehydrogenase
VLTGDSFFHLAPYGGPLPGLGMCGAGRVVCLIDPVGDVYACPFAIHPQFLAGNVRQPGGTTGPGLRHQPARWLWFQSQRQPAARNERSTNSTKGMTDMAGRVEGKVAFITGAARGQGRSHAVTLAREGADIIAVDLCAQIASVPYPMATPEDLAQTVKEVEAAGRRIVATQADVRDYDALKVALDDGVAQLGRLDIVSANSGICSYGRAEELDEQTWRDMIDVNLTGEWHTAKAAIPHLRAGGRGGSMILTSSDAGLKASQNLAHYVSAKHGLIGLMRTLALELAPDFIRVNALAPTTVDTPMSHNEATYRLFCPDLENPTADDMAGPATALNVLPIPWVEPVDISNALVFLASDEARYITGVALPVDAGAAIK